MNLERAELGGVPVYWAETPDPFVAALVFRVGRADETLSTSGITHLIEHLAIPPRRSATNLDVNGTVSSSETVFWAAGRRDEALEALGGILAGLAKLPLERLEAERRILSTEAASSSPGPVQAAAALRFGTKGYGLIGYDELGLPGLTAPDVEQWCRERFNAANAAIWMTGKPPRDFSTSLEPGARHPMPDSTPIRDLTLPAHNVGGPSGGVSASMVIERSFAANVVLEIAEERLMQRLRFERGITYGAHVLYDWLSSTLAHVTIWADCLDTQAAEARDELLAVLRDLAGEGPTPAELDEATESLKRTVKEPLEAPNLLFGLAAEELAGGHVHSLEELVVGRSAVEPAAAAEELARGMTLLLLTTPAGTGDVLESFTRYPLYSPRRVAGKAHRARGLHLQGDVRKLRLLVADDGLSLITPQDEALTVFFGECSAMQRWADGTRTLWSEDGFRVEVTPYQWRGGKKIADVIDQHVRADVVVAMQPEIEQHAEGLPGGDPAKRSAGDALAFDALARHLRGDERVLLLVEASQGLKEGLLAATDRRLLFVYVTDLVLELPWQGVTAVDAKSEPRLWSENTLALTTPEGKKTFSEIKPKDRLEDLAALIRERAGIS